MKLRLSLLTHTVIAALVTLALGLPAQTLIHRYSFNESPGSTTFADSVGGPAWSGSLFGGATLDGSSLQLDGFSGFATVPSGILGGASAVTVEFWADFSPSNPFWTRVFAFGEQDGSGGQLTGLDYCHYAGGNWQNLNLTVSNANVWANNPGGLNGQTNVHVTCIVNPPANQMFYYNGTRVASNPGVNGNNGIVPPLSGMNDTLCLIGKSLWDIDATLQGAIHEFRVYTGALSSAQVAINDAAGPDAYVTDPGALQSVQLISPDNPLLVNQQSQQIFKGNFANVSGVDLIAYGGATFTSGNTAILTVNPTNGLVVAISPGTTTVVASFGGMSATNTLTVVAVPAVLAHRYSFASDASDSVGGAHGTLMGNATISGGKVVLDGTSGTYVDLPGNIININTNVSITIEAWVDFGDVPNWCRLFNFGNDGGSSEIYLAPRGPQNGANHRLSQNIAGGRTTDWRGAWANLSAHIVCVMDPPSGTMAVYRDGVLEYARYDATAPLSLVSSSVAVLGRSLVGADPYMPGAIDEFRIYHGALTPAEIARSYAQGPNSTNRNPGALNSITVVATNYPAYSTIVPPVILANYANLPGFNLLPNNSAVVNGLTLTSSDTNVLQVLPNNMLRTLRPGTVTLSASYLGKTHSATVAVRNRATLAHRYTFTTDTSDSVGTAHGTPQGNATVSGGSLVLDGTSGTYLVLPSAMLDGYDAVTIETWVTFNTAATWARLWYFGDDRANEFWFGPSTSGGAQHWYSTGFPIGGYTFQNSPRFENQTVHLTFVYGNGVMEYYTNGVVRGSNQNVTGRLDQVGRSFSWIGRSPYPDPFLNASVHEFRIYRGRLSPQEIQATEILGPDQLLTTSANLTATVSGGNLVLSWPVAAAGFVVQTSSSLSGGTWVTLPDTPTLVGNQWQVTVPLGSGPQFFRLWK